MKKWKKGFLPIRALLAGSLTAALVLLGACAAPAARQELGQLQRVSQKKCIETVETGVAKNHAGFLRAGCVR
ncbi:hypothetical protein [Acutalibacter intestini]|uniref:hypothetical protein n=1 Tax=Acutalibacter intestini TaxID=3093659 RepID=UPI002AC9689A|nr:hypothetical protein [Acutalibacter sp. M00204]